MTPRLRARAHSIHKSPRHPKRRPPLAFLGAMGLATFLVVYLACGSARVVRRSLTSDPLSFTGVTRGTETPSSSGRIDAFHGYELKSWIARTASRRQGDFGGGLAGMGGGVGNTRSGDGGSEIWRTSAWESKWELVAPMSRDELRATSGNGDSVGPRILVPSGASGGSLYPKVGRAERVDETPLDSAQDGKTQRDTRTAFAVDDGRPTGSKDHTPRSPGLRGGGYRSKPNMDRAESMTGFSGPAVHVTPAAIPLSKPSVGIKGAAAGHGEDSGHLENAAGGNENPLVEDMSAGGGQYSGRDTTEAAGPGENEYAWKSLGEGTRNSSRIAGAAPGGEVPNWARPSTEELKRIIADQVGRKRGN